MPSSLEGLLTARSITTMSTRDSKLSNHQQRRLEKQAKFDVWTDKCNLPFEVSVWSRPKKVDVWHGSVKYEWLLCGKLRVFLQVPIWNWTPPTDEQYADRRTAQLQAIVKAQCPESGSSWQDAAQETIDRLYASQTRERKEARLQARLKVRLEAIPGSPWCLNRAAGINPWGGSTGC
jgi:hypothetical protein